MGKNSHALQAEQTVSSDAALLPLTILLVEDSPSDARLFEKVLGRANDASRFTIVHAKRLANAVKLINRQQFDIIILDLCLPDSDGLESIAKIRVENSRIPIIVMTGLNDEKTGLAALRKGAQDYIVKGSIDGNVLSESIKYSIERHQILSTVETERERHEYFASHDQLTDLPNRKGFLDHIDLQIKEAALKAQVFGIFFLDLNDFKSINDQFGHSIGDSFLKDFAQRLSKCLRPGDVACRYGGDKFAIYLYDIKSAENATLAADRFIAELTPTYKVGKYDVNPNISMGISIYPQDSNTPEGILSAADFAMLQAKQLGRNHYRFYVSSMNMKAQELKDLEGQLESALTKKQFEVYYQPEFEVITGRILGVQGLVRWRHPDLGIVPARHFMPPIENTDFLIRLNFWVLDTALEDLKAWHEGGFKKICLSLNLAPAAFQNKDFLEQLSRALKKSGIDPSTVRFEVREADVLLDRTRNLAFLKDLKSLGVQILLDGFGAGFSSLTQLDKMSLSAVKIDSGIIHKCAQQEESRSVLKAIVELARGFQLETIAEGVETKEQYWVSQACGVSRVQGFYLAKPVPSQHMALFLRAKAEAL